MHNTSKLIFGRQKIWIHNKTNVFCSVIFVTFGLLDKIVQNHDSGKFVSAPFSKSFSVVCLWPRSTTHVLGLYAYKNRHENILYNYKN